MSSTLSSRACSGAPRFPPVVDARHDRQHDHHDDHQLDVLIDAGNVATEKISGEEHAPDPENAAEHIERGEPGVVHSGRARHDRHERADDGHESRYHDGLAAVTLVEVVGLAQVLRFEEHGLFFLEQSWPAHSANPVADGVADDRGGAENCAEEIYVQSELRLGGEQAGGDQ